MIGPGDTRAFEIEVAASRTWPTSVLREADGWLLRSCQLLTRKRSNSALPPSAIRDVEASVDRVERFYRACGSNALVQVSPRGQHRELDGLLGARGYRSVSPTEVLTAEVGALADPAPDDVRVVLHGSPEPEWFSACDRVGLSREPGLARIPAPVAFAVAERGSLPVGVALVAVDGAWAGVYCLSTYPDARGSGVARAVVSAGARWAAARGAAELFLQVESHNERARGVFARLGFVRSHGYHYRIRDRISDALD